MKQEPKHWLLEEEAGVEVKTHADIFFIGFLRPSQLSDCQRIHVLKKMQSVLQKTHRHKAIHNQNSDKSTKKWNKDGDKRGILSKKITAWMHK